MEPFLQRMRSFRAKCPGFTLVEFLVVVLILGILLAISLPLYQSSQRNANLNACKANMNAIYQAEEAYRSRAPDRDNPYIASSDAANWPTITGMLGGEPRCPTDGSAYIVTVSGRSVTVACSGSHTQTPIYVDSSWTAAGARPGIP